MGNSLLSIPAPDQVPRPPRLGRVRLAIREFLAILRTGRPTVTLTLAATTELDPDLIDLYERVGRAAALDAVREAAEDKAMVDGLVADFARNLVSERMTARTAVPALRVIQGGAS
jgi:hypothetical protein